MDTLKLQAPYKKITFNCKGRLVVLDKPAVMGILNVTPDSFFEKSRQKSLDESLEHASKMLADGALFIDIGGYSTRPGADDVPVDEELERVVPVIAHLSKHLPAALISVDTFRASVAKEAVNAGAHIVNDVSAGDDDEHMISTVANLQVPYVMMHKKGTPKTMQLNPHYDNLVQEIIDYFIARITKAKQAGIKDVIIDPGFGFAKTLQHNYALLHALGDLGVLGHPVLVGVSRKGMIQKITGTNAEHALNGTTAVHTIALLNGANILRVHDVKEATECINIVNATHGLI